jgi:hypothetical protein
MKVWVRVAMITAAVMALEVIITTLLLQAYINEHGLSVSVEAIALIGALLGFVVALVALVLAIRSRHARPG